MNRTLVALLALAACGSAEGQGRVDGGPDWGGSADGPRYIPDGGGTPGSDLAQSVVCSGSISGGLSGAISQCSVPYVWGYNMSTRDTTGMDVQRLNGQPFDVGVVEFTYELLGPPNTTTTYTFSNIRGGVSNIYQNHPGSMTIWACGTNGAGANYGAMTLNFTSVTDVGNFSGTEEWIVHGQIACHYVAQDGSPDIDLQLTF